MKTAPSEVTFNSGIWNTQIICATSFCFLFLLQLRRPIELKFSQVCYFVHLCLDIHQVRILVFELPNLSSAFKDVHHTATCCNSWNGRLLGLTSLPGRQFRRRLSEKERMEERPHAPHHDRNVLSMFWFVTTQSYSQLGDKLHMGSIITS